MRGKKGTPHLDPADPPRPRANKRRGHGTYENDRPPIFQVIARTSSQLRLFVRERTDQKTCEEVILRCVAPGSHVMLASDEWRGYARLSKQYQLNHRTVRHSADEAGAREWARDDDGDGRREVHCNGCEGSGASLRTFLRRFRGVRKDYLADYCACYQTMYNAKRISTQVIRKMCCFSDQTHANWG